MDDQTWSTTGTPGVNQTDLLSSNFTTVVSAAWPLPAMLAMWTLILAVSLLTVGGNALVLTAYRLDRGLQRHISNRYVVSLAVSDLIIGIEGFPFFTIYVTNGERWTLGKTACQTWLFLDYTLCLVSILTVLLITIDRYLSVCYTANYLKWQSDSRAQYTIYVSWVLPAVFFGIMIFGWEEDPVEQEQMDEKQLAERSAKCTAPFLNDPYVNMIMYFVYYWATLVAMLILYKGIHRAAQNLEKKGEARELRTMALLTGQRFGAQIGVTLTLAVNGDDAATTVVPPPAVDQQNHHSQREITASTRRQSSSSLRPHSSSSAAYHTAHHLAPTDARDSGYHTTPIGGSLSHLAAVSHETPTTHEPSVTPECHQLQRPLLRTAIVVQSAEANEADHLLTSAVGKTKYMSMAVETDVVESPTKHVVVYASCQASRAPPTIIASTLDGRRQPQADNGSVISDFADPSLSSVVQMSDELLSRREDEDGELAPAYDDITELVSLTDCRTEHTQDTFLTLTADGAAVALANQLKDAAVNGDDTLLQAGSESTSERLPTSRKCVDFVKSDQIVRRNSATLPAAGGAPPTPADCTAMPLRLIRSELLMENDVRGGSRCNSNPAVEPISTKSDVKTKAAARRHLKRTKTLNTATFRQTLNTTARRLRVGAAVKEKDRLDRLEPGGGNNETRLSWLIGMDPVSSSSSDDKGPLLLSLCKRGRVKAANTLNTATFHQTLNTTARRLRVGAAVKEKDRLDRLEPGGGNNETRLSWLIGMDPVSSSSSDDKGPLLLSLCKRGCVKAANTLNTATFHQTLNTTARRLRVGAAVKEKDRLDRLEPGGGNNETRLSWLIGMDPVSSSSSDDKGPLLLSLCKRGRVKAANTLNTATFHQTLNTTARRLRVGAAVKEKDRLERLEKGGGNNETCLSSLIGMDPVSSSSSDDKAAKRKQKKAPDNDDSSDSSLSLEDAVKLFKGMSANNDADSLNEIDELPVEQSGVSSTSKRPVSQRSGEGVLLDAGIARDASTVERSHTSCRRLRPRTGGETEVTATQSRLVTTLFAPIERLRRRRKRTRAERRARKAFRTISFIVGFFALFWSPYFVVATLYGFCARCVPAPVFIISYYLCYVNSSGNPFAYALANRQFKTAFLRILSGDFRHL